MFYREHVKRETSNREDEQNQKLFFDNLNKPCYD